MEPHPAARSVSHEGGPVGVLLCHGFTGSPASLRPWAEHLAKAGYTVELPRLPGHGSSRDAMSITRWPDWFTRVERSLLLLAQRCETIIVAGLSMGGCLALRLAQVHGAHVQGLVLVNPAIASADRRLLALPVLRHLVPSMPGISNDIALPGQDEHAYHRTPLKPLHSYTQMWKRVRRDLPAITQPVLLFRSANDHVVDGTSAPLILSGVSSSDVTHVLLHRSHHVATLDYDAETIFTKSHEFIERLTAHSPAADVTVSRGR